MEKFVVSARKYRPITFESVVGQGHITSTLRNAIETNQVAHAYLFCGPRGVGKTTCARILSKSLNCLNRKEGSEACGTCESCQAFNENRSFNIHELDAASNNSVEYIRSLNEQVRIPPQLGKYSIYIIDEAHMLSTAAFNAFLKTLEEPPAHAIFILATTEKHKILPTILSRCQTYDFKRIRVEDMVSFLSFISSKEGVTYDDESLNIIAQKSEGCMRDALSMYDKVVSFCGDTLNFKAVAEAVNVLDYDSYFRFTSHLTGGDYRSALLQLDEVLQKGFDSATFLSGLANHLRNLLVAADSSTISLLEATGSITQRYIEQVKRCSPAFIFEALNIITAAESASRNSLNIRLLTELTLLKLCNLSQNKISSETAAPSINLPKAETVKATAPQVAEPTPQVAANAPTTNITSTKPEVEAAKPEPTPEPVAEASTEERVEEIVEAVQEITAETATKSVAEAAAEPVVEPEKVAPIKRQHKSMLGVSISSMINNHEEEKAVEAAQNTAAEQATQEEESAFTKIKEEDYEKVIAGCMKYADRLRKSRPRLSIAFDHPVIVDGELIIEVQSSILEDELNTNRHAITSSLINISGVDILHFRVVVNEAVVQTKNILIKDDDKLKFLVEQNSEVQNLCSALKLDFV